MRRLVLSILYVFFCASTLMAQSETATLSGRLTDVSGGVIAKADVTVTNTDTNVSATTSSNESGIYIFPSLQPGNYRLSIQAKGFREFVETGITLHTQDRIAENISMRIGSIDERVVVAASGININTTDAAVSTVIDRDFVENMPLNGRSLQDLWTLVPGVAPSASNGSGFSGEITVNGQRTEANSFSVDGVSANVGTSPGSFGSGAGYGGGTPAETALGTTQSLVSVDALQEFRATTSSYSAEYGRTPGGQFSFTTRSGTNDWHGSAFDYLRNEDLDANNYFNNAEAVPREKERQNDFGGTLGGPIRIPHLYNGKDKTFFFFSYEGLRLWTPEGLLTLSVPDQTLRQQAPAALQPILNAFPLPNKGEDGLDDGLGIFEVGQSFPSSINSVSIRLDHEFTDKFKIFGRFANTPSVSSYISGADRQNSEINNRVLTLGVTNLITNTQANEFHFNVTQVNSISNNVLTSLDGATPFDITTLPGAEGSNLLAVGSILDFRLEFGGYPQLVLGLTRNAQRQYNLTDTYSRTLGRHTLKFGIDWRRLSTYVAPYVAGESAGFRSESAVLANNVGSSGFISATSQSPVPVEPLYKNISLFAQDEWKTTPRLSLSVGLRWDVNPAPTNLTGTSPYTLNQITNLSAAEVAPAGTPLWKTDWHAFAPRIGGAYQLRQEPGRDTVLRAGFGMFYDMGTTLGSQGFQGIGFTSFSNFTNVSFPLTSAQMTLPPPNVAAPYNGPVFAFDPSLRLPYTLQWNVALEQALGNKQALTLTYVGSVGRQLLETYQLFPGYPNYAESDGLNITKNGPTSEYNALQLQFQRTLSHGLQALASYTFSHSIDNASSNFDLSDLLERASSDFDIRHNFQGALTYDVPGQYSNPVLSGLLKHWSLDMRVTARSALPVDVIGNAFVIDAATNANVNYHPNLIPGQPLYLYGSQYPGGKIINYGAFTIPSSGPGFDSEGDTPRNYARGFGAWQMNFAIRREFPIHERLHLQFRAEAFNLFNHSAFSSISNYLGFGPYDPSCVCGFGVAAGTLNQSLGGLNSLYQTGGPRSFQFALKTVF